MSDSCVFCKIVRKEAPASVVYEDEFVIAFMSIQPVNIGHTLVVPKKHYANLFEIPEEEHVYLYKIVKKIAHAVREAMSAAGIRIVQNNGAAAGQVIFHLHVHVIPVNTPGSFMRYPELRDAQALAQDAARIKRFV
ncbi:MAG: HIT family protein [Candidatus Bathyarchaeota archaeon]|nr:HIT family protein [Candidatus Bathyarchaeota archaeon]